MTTLTQSIALGAAFVAAMLASTPVHACSMMPPQDGCYLTGLRATNSPYIVQGTIDRYGPDQAFETRNVFINLQTESILAPLPASEEEEEEDVTREGGDHNSTRLRGLRTGRVPRTTTTTSAQEILQGIELAPFPVPQPPSNFVVTAKGSTVTITNNTSGKFVCLFDLVEAECDADQGDRIGFFHEAKTISIWVFHAKNRSHWNGIQITKALPSQNQSHTLPCKDWNDSGDAWCWTQGKIDHCPNLELAAVCNGDAMCGRMTAMHNNQCSLQVHPEIRGSTMMGVGMSGAPVCYPQSNKEVWTLSETDDGGLGSVEHAMTIEKVSIRLGQVTEQHHICQCNIAKAGGCPAPDRNPRETNCSALLQRNIPGNKRLLLTEKT